MAKLLSAYVEWSKITRHIPKIHRYSIGVKIDTLWCEVTELVSLAQFSVKEPRAIILDKAISKNDCLKFMLYVLFELKGIDEKYFFPISLKAEEIGKMLYGWKNSK